MAKAVRLGKQETEISRTKEDFLGNEYGAGDTVLFATGGSLGFGEVARITDLGNVTIYPTVSSRYSTNTRTIYIDKRTGARIAPYDKKHWSREYGYIHTPTGKFFTYEEREKYLYPETGYRDYDKPQNPETKDFTYATHEYKPYVMGVKVMQYPITVFKDRQVMKWEGPVGETKQAD
jgi:hypothetical protein